MYVCVLCTYIYNILYIYILYTIYWCLLVGDWSCAASCDCNLGRALCNQ